VRQRADLMLVPPASLRLTLDMADGKRLMVEKTASHSRQPSAISHGSGAPRSRGPGSKAPAPSWWTARAHAGEVKPGFTKEAILRPARDDPRAPGGLFELVGGVLSELLDRR